jgi:hypothetical protein
MRVNEQLAELYSDPGDLNPTCERSIKFFCDVRLD